jgi:hypothetical protein
MWRLHKSGCSDLWLFKWCCKVFFKYFSFHYKFFYKLSNTQSRHHKLTVKILNISEWLADLCFRVNCAQVVIPNCLENSMIRMAPQPPRREPHSHHRPDQLFCCDLPPGSVGLPAVGSGTACSENMLRAKGTYTMPTWPDPFWMYIISRLFNETIYFAEINGV